MPERAKVTSVEAIESFRASLLVFLSKARPAVEEISTGVLRTRTWVENDQRTFWERQIRSLARQLDEARQELFSARMSKLQDATAAQEMAVHRLQRTLRIAEDKQRVTKKWGRELDNRAAPLLKEVEQLHTCLATDMPKAVAYLDQVLRALEAYRSVAPAAASAAVTSEVPAETGTPQPENEKLKDEK